MQARLGEGERDLMSTTRGATRYGTVLSHDRTSGIGIAFPPTISNSGDTPPCTGQRSPKIVTAQPLKTRTDRPALFCVCRRRTIASSPTVINIFCSARNIFSGCFEVVSLHPSTWCTIDCEWRSRLWKMRRTTLFEMPGCISYDDSTFETVTALKPWRALAKH